MKKHLLTNSYNGGGITKLKRNAFTLIELLAIIVILAIIAVITVPIILNIIENSRKGAATDSAYGYKDSVNKYYIAELQNHNKLKLDGTYTVNSSGELLPDTGYDFGDETITKLSVPVSGTVPSSGSLEYQNNVLKSGYLVIGDYRVTFNSDGTVTTAKNTGSSSTESEESGQVVDSSDDNQSSDTPVEETWDYFYSYDYLEYSHGTTVDLSWTNYIRENTESGKREVCGVFSGGTICLDASKENDSNYINDKISELRNKGAICKEDDGFCYDPDGPTRWTGLAVGYGFQVQDNSLEDGCSVEAGCSSNNYEYDD